jgi:hypothetical protein
MVDSNNNPIGASDVHLRAPANGIITHPSCNCDAAVNGVSYGTAWTAGLAARFFAEGYDYAAVKNMLTSTPNQSVRYPGNVQATEVEPTPTRQPLAAPLRLSRGHAVLYKGRLHIRWSTNRHVSYKVIVGQRTIYTRNTKTIVRARTAPRFVYVKSGTKSIRIIVLKRR